MNKILIIIAVVIIALIGGGAFFFFGGDDVEPTTPADVESSIEVTGEVDGSFNVTEDGVVYTDGDLHNARTQFLVVQSSNSDVQNVLRNDIQIEQGDVVITPAEMIDIGAGGVDLAWKPYENAEFSSEWHEISSIHITDRHLENTGMEDATEYTEEVGEDGDGEVVGIGDVELELTPDGVRYYGTEIADTYDAGNVFYENRGDRTVLTSGVPEDDSLLVEGNEVASNGIAPGSKLYFVFSPIDSNQQYLGVVTIPDSGEIIESWGFMSANIGVEERGFVYNNGTIDTVYDSGGGIQVRYDGTRTDIFDGVPENNETVATPEQITDIPIPSRTDVRVEYTNGNEEYFLDNVQTPSRSDGGVGSEWPYISGNFLVNANGLVYVDGELDRFDDGQLVMSTHYNRYTIFDGVPEDGETVAPNAQLRELGVPLGQSFELRFINDGNVYDLGEYDMPTEDEDAIIGGWDYIEGDVAVVDDGIEYRGDPSTDFAEFDGGEMRIDVSSKRDRHVYTGIPNDGELIVDQDNIAENRIPSDTLVNVYFVPDNEDARLYVGSVTTPDADSDTGIAWGYGDGSSDGSINVDGIIDPIVGFITPPYF